jgi:hypothetical protein
VQLAISALKIGITSNRIDRFCFCLGGFCQFSRNYWKSNWWVFIHHENDVRVVFFLTTSDIEWSCSDQVWRTVCQMWLPDPLLNIRTHLLNLQYQDKMSSMKEIFRISINPVIPLTLQSCLPPTARSATWMTRGETSYINRLEFRRYRSHE